MSEENGKVCCNCRHCIRSRDEKYKMTICTCEITNRYLSYAQVMQGWCKHWTIDRIKELMNDNAPTVIEAEGKE